MKRVSGLAMMAILAVVAATGVSCSAQATTPDPSHIGMGVHMMFDDAASIDRQFDLMEQMNVTTVRIDFDWSAIEPEPGQYNWSYQDRIVEQAAARGMQILALLTYTPNWARPPGTTSHVPPDREEDFATFAQAAATRYAPRGVHSWEIWNEPNTSDFWLPLPDVDRYGALFLAAAEAIRQVDGNATVITGGLTRGTDTADGHRISQLTFLTGLYRNGAAQVADAIAVHPYSFPVLPSASDPDVVGGFADLPQLHALMRREGDADKKIWITEFGAPTGTAPEAMSDREQAESLLEARRMAGDWDWAGPLIFYELRDSGTDPAELEQNFGVVRVDLSLKDAGKALMK
ncbi:Beta-xylosidase [Mycolicibacterium vanbaalenii]|uniref:Beta-xylosidase n=1 Tax=Mycolicibacterium vanbaalenii TaxID=110539 RepID=A0A5S9R4Z7_MYCVN|nr:cellulase family glycosylhydrolase [Mycolicibacterium vanbaalenii]CAA0128273.1 Beta-xylosidase [Mycolicibacterium vanbaalenii]